MTPRTNNDQPNTNTIYFLSLPVSTIKTNQLPKSPQTQGPPRTDRPHPPQQDDDCIDRLIELINTTPTPMARTISTAHLVTRCIICYESPQQKSSILNNTNNVNPSESPTKTISKKTLEPYHPCQTKP
jgi:hypothetical protein